MLENNKNAATISARARTITDPAGREKRVISEADAGDLADAMDIHLGQVYAMALENGIWPLRYLRNSDTLSPSDQLRLARSRVAVIGAGGLGGYVLTLLARVGIGGLVIVDPETFEETNLNRQMFATRNTLGENKALAAARLLAGINPAVEIASFPERLTPVNAAALISGVHVAVDALDNIDSRRVLQAAAEKNRIPMVHGAIAGFTGQIMTVFPGEAGILQIYGKPDNDHNQEQGPSPEDLLGVPAVTPALVGTFQAMEVIKILLNRKDILNSRMLAADLEAGRVDFFQF
jgi:molybdopterin/thiamine biosynthesis adenylyltransferase